MTAVPNTGYHFVDWSDGVLTAARTDLDVTANLTVTANFAIDTFTLTYTAGAGGTHRPAYRPQTVDYGADGTPGHSSAQHRLSLRDWSDGVLTAARTDLDVTANLSVTANFAINTYTLTYTAGAAVRSTAISPRRSSTGGRHTGDGRAQHRLPLRRLDRRRPARPHAPTWTSWPTSPSRPTSRSTPSP